MATLSRDFVVVLNQPQDVVNIAGTVRALMNMGMTRLRLVAPDDFDPHRIAGIAHGSEAVIDGIAFFDTLPEALADAGHVVGTTARRRTAPYVWQRPRQAAPELWALAATAPGPIALVFGREDKGLSNEDLDLCDRVLVIPTDPAHSSLNLAQAVLIVTYELAGAARRAAPLPVPKRHAAPAAPAQLQLVFRDLESALESIEFFKSRNSQAIMRSVRALLRRAAPSQREANLVRAMAIEVRKFMARRLGEGG